MKHPFIQKLSLAVALSIVMLSFSCVSFAGEETRPRARELGLQVGILSTGKFNAITDVDGVKVGHHTVKLGDDVRLGLLR